MKLGAGSREGGAEAGRSGAASRLEGKTAAGALKSDAESCRKETLLLTVWQLRTAQADDKFPLQSVDADGRPAHKSRLPPAHLRSRLLPFLF